MSVISKAFGIWVVSKTVSSTTPLFIRLLVGMAAITVCAVIAAIILAILVTGVVWFAYEQLLQHGASQGSASVIIGALLLVLLSCIVIAIKAHLKNLHDVSKNILYFQAPISGALTNISNAFMDGFHSTPFTPPHTPKL